jgi:hypothetical protein
MTEEGRARQREGRGWVGWSWVREIHTNNFLGKLEFFFI